MVLRWIVIGLVAMLPITSHALVMGKLKVLSSLNEPLKAEIEFTSVTDKELKGLDVALASHADFVAAGVEQLPFLSSIKFNVTKRSGGRIFLELSTDQQVNEPFLHLLLQIEWPGGRLVREYTALIDPPYKVTSRAPRVDAPKIAAPTPEPEVQPPAPPTVAETAPPVTQKKITPPPVTKLETPKPKIEETPPTEKIAKEIPLEPTIPGETILEDRKFGPPDYSLIGEPDYPGPKVEPLDALTREEAVSPKERMITGTESSFDPMLAGISEYQVNRGDILWDIAEQVRGGNPDVTMEQVMLAIYRTNKDAFFGNNVNNLKAGKILKIPEIEVAENINSTQARREFRAQYDAWQEYKLKLASASNVIEVTEAQVPPAPPPAPVAKIEQPPPAPTPAPVKEKAKPDKPAPSAAEKAKSDELLKIVRSTLQKDKTTPDKTVTESESAEETETREQQALADRAATLEESLESKRLENKELTDKVGIVRSQLDKESRLIELENESLAQKPPTTTAKTAPSVETAPPPAEAPAQPPPEAKATVEPLPPTPKTAPPPRAQRKRIPPPPPPVEEKDFFSTIMEAVQSDLLAPILIGVVVLLSGGIAMVYFRRRQRSIAEFEESILSADAISTEQPVTTGDVTVQPKGAVTTGSDTSFLSDFSQGGMGNIHTDEVDPIAEAEVYLAYGRDETAEEILKEAVVKNPDRQELKVKLLEIYQQRNDVSAFETLAEELYAAVGGRGGKVWEKVEEMGRKLNPENPMFRGGEPAKAGAPAEQIKTAATGAATNKLPDDQATEASTAKSDALGDFDFDIGTPAETPTAVAEPDDSLVSMPESPAVEPPQAPGIESPDVGKSSSDDGGIDFDIGGQTEAAPTPDLTPPSPPIPASNDIQWEPETPDAKPVEEKEPATETEVELAAAPAEGEGQGSSQWDETATKLDLAKAYIDMGDTEGARSILQEVMSEGSESQKKQAQELSSQIA